MGDARQLPSGLFVVEPTPEPSPPADPDLPRCRLCGKVAPAPGGIALASAGWRDHRFTCRHENPVTCSACAKAHPDDHPPCSTCGNEWEFT